MLSNNTQIEFMIDKGEGDREQKQRHRDNLRDVIKYCENQIDCRRKLILMYFNENFNPADCHATCDNCEAPRQLVTMDRTEHGVKAVKLLKSISGRATSNQLLDIFRGSLAKPYAAYRRLEHFGSGKDLSRTEVERLVQHLLIENILQEQCVSNAMGFVNTYVRVPPSPLLSLFLVGKKG
jgi:bloom syndrome protein